MFAPFFLPPCNVSCSCVGLTVSYFLLILRNTKLYETGHCFAKFRSFREIRNKVFRVVFAKLKKTFHFVVSHIFIEMLCLLFEFCTFHSRFVPFIPFSKGGILDWRDKGKEG